MVSFHLHLVSDSTGGTVNAVSRAMLAQFEEVEPMEHNWPLIRTASQVEKVLTGIREHPGFVLYTMSDENLRHQLKEECESLNVPCISVLSRPICDLSAYLGITTSARPSNKQNKLDKEYFSRVEAVNFAISHDDGQGAWELEEADIVLLGVSRTSKSPTSMFLAFRGYRTANVPFVSGVELPGNIEKLRNPLIVGLTLNPENLVNIRKNRLLSLNQDEKNLYTDFDQVKAEIDEASRFFIKHRWPVIDVTRRSVEETVAKIIQIYERKRR